MDNDWVIRTISEQVYQQYPEFTGVHPKIQQIQTGKSAHFTLTYQTTVRTASGLTLRRRVKVVSNPQGKIQKITSSK